MAQLRDSGAIVSKTSLKQVRNENAIEAAILNHVLDHDWTLNRRGPLSIPTGFFFVILLFCFFFFLVFLSLFVIVIMYSSNVPQERHQNTIILFYWRNRAGFRPLPRSPVLWENVVLC